MELPSRRLSPKFSRNFPLPHIRIENWRNLRATMGRRPFVLLELFLFSDRIGAPAFPSFSDSKRRHIRRPWRRRRSQTRLWYGRSVQGSNPPYILCGNFLRLFFNQFMNVDWQSHLFSFNCPLTVLYIGRLLRTAKTSSTPPVNNYVGKSSKSQGNQGTDSLFRRAHRREVPASGVAT